MLQLAARLYPLLDELRAGEKTCLLVAHNGIARVVHSYFHELGNGEFAAFGIHNCELRSYRFMKKTGSPSHRTQRLESDPSFLIRAAGAHHI